MGREYNRKILLEDGTSYLGFAFGAVRDLTAELVFNTSMVGYQEILSDPSYTHQAVVMTYPLIGNYGMAAEDYETSRPTIGALIVREYNDEPSNFRCQETLGSVMERFGIPGIWGVDTRQLTRRIRDFGSVRVRLTGAGVSDEEAMAALRASQVPHDAVSLVSRRNIQTVKAPGAKYHVVAIDCGMKENIVRCLVKKGCDVTIVPWDAGPDFIAAMKPGGVFLSNGPGDPTDVQQVIQTAKALRGRFPMFGICLGHQILALSYGAKTYKLKFGHRGGNHPVKNLLTGKIEITSQNHSYAVDRESLSGTPLEITHANILDDTVEGLRCERDRVFSVQYHPESAPGPQDSSYLFDQFIQMMEEGKGHA